MQRRIAITLIAGATAIFLGLVVYRHVADYAAMWRRVVLLIWVISVAMLMVGLALLYQPRDTVRGFEIGMLQAASHMPIRRDFIADATVLQPMQAINNEEDFCTAMGAERAILFCHAEWSMPSVYARQTVQDWYRAESGRQKVPLFMVMPSDQAFVREWLEREGLSRLESRGSGEVLWVERGHVVDKVLVNVSVSQLRERTRERWG